jgi:hypothetical protein
LTGKDSQEEAMLACSQISVELWKEGPRAVNLEVMRLLGESQPSVRVGSIDEPSPEPGPDFNMTEQGLSLKRTTTVEGSFDDGTQDQLHRRLRRIAPMLAEQTRRVGNAHPGLEVVTAEYADLIDRPLGDINIVALWAVGTGLLANREAFSRPHDASLMAEALEPEHLALLRQVAEIHGGFILGFAEGRELTERSDRARLSAEAMEAVVAGARSILGEIRRAGSRVESHTREFLAAIDAGLVEPGWKITRAGHVAYVVTRNALIAIGRLLTFANSSLSTIVGGVILSSIDPGLIHTQFWIGFVLEHSKQILAFAEPFPELKIWLSAQIEAADRDRKARLS